MNKYAFLFLLSCFCVQAQNESKFLLITDSIKGQKLEEVAMIKNERKYRGRKTLEFNCNNNNYLKYSDNYSDNNYVEFEELGVIKNSIIVVLKIEYNSEQYILLETKNCRQLILEGFPLKIGDTEQYLTLNNPKTDEKYKIQMFDYKDGFFVLKNTIVFPKEILPKKILKADSNEVFILDLENRIWKTIL